MAEYDYVKGLTRLATMLEIDLKRANTGVLMAIKIERRRNSLFLIKKTRNRKLTSAVRATMIVAANLTEDGGLMVRELVTLKEKATYRSPKEIHYWPSVQFNGHPKEQKSENKRNRQATGRTKPQHKQCNRPYNCPHKEQLQRDGQIHHPSHQTITRTEKSHTRATKQTYENRIVDWQKRHADSSASRFPQNNQIRDRESVP
ncbi:hypothetical protein WN48_07871 [Eufriesea mexicana]|nr:hypothetical protein WN48_07871 [Eufriesea mexicana]